MRIIHIIIGCILLFSSMSYGQTLSLPYKDIAGWMLVEVQVDQKPLNLLFDTGWDGMALKSDLLHAYGPQHAILVKDANHVYRNVPTYLVDSLSINGHVFKDIPMTDFNSFPMLSDPIFECYQIDGVLGNVVFKDKMLEIDPVNKMIRLHEYSPQLYQELEDKGFDVIQNIAPANTHRVMLPLQVNQMSMPFVFDTGDTGGLSFSLPYIDNALFSSDGVYLYYGIGNVGAFGLDTSLNQIVIDRHSQVNIAGQRFDHTEVLYTQSDQNFQMGVEYIKAFHWLIDPFTRQVFFKKLDKTPSVSTLTKLDFGIAYIEGDYRVGAVSATQEQVRLGDIVLSIDGIKMQDLCGYRNYLRTKTGVVQLEVLRNNMPLVVEVQL